MRQQKPLFSNIFMLHKAIAFLVEIALLGVSVLPGASDGHLAFASELNAAPTLSSAADQVFEVNDPAAEIATITLTDSASSSVITAANDIRIVIPDDLNMTWDATSLADVVIGGTAAGKLQAVSLISPYKPIVNRHKVNLHGHTTQSDGKQSPTEYMQTYRDLGYAATIISDHDKVTTDPGVPGIFHISGVENTAGGGHMNSIDISTFFAGTRQQQIDNTIDQGGFASINHPMSGWIERIAALNGFAAMEIWNARYGSGEKYADAALSAGKRFWLLGTDDLHMANEIYRGWIVVNSIKDAEEITKEDILREIRDGNFYAMGRGNNAANPGESTQHVNLPYPAEFTQISVSGNTVTAGTDKSVKLEFITNKGTVSQTDNDVTAASYVSSPEDVYVRVKATYVEEGKSAYTFSNPIFVREAGAGSISFEDDNKTLVIDVAEDFSAGDTLTIAGLKFDNFEAEGSEHLALVVRGASGPIAATDDKTITIGSGPPVQSAWNPADADYIATATPTITLTLSENGDCRSSTADQGYDDMSFDCTGDGTMSISCTTGDLGADGAKTVFIACRDTALNADTAATNIALSYTLDTPSPIFHYFYATFNDVGAIFARTAAMLARPFIFCFQKIGSSIKSAFN